MKLKTFLLSGVSLLGMTTAAYAGAGLLTTLTLAIFAGPVGSVLGPGAIYAGLQILGTTALIGGQLLSLAGRKPGSINPGEFKQTLETEETSEVNGVGRVRVAGVRAFGNTKHPNIHRVFLHLRGEVDFAELFYINGRETILTDTGKAITPPWFYEATVSGGPNPWDTTTVPNSYVTITQKLGDGTETAIAELITDFPDLWTSNHRIRGIFHTHMKIISPGISQPKYLTLFSSGPELDFETVVRAAKFYDPREGSHLVNDSSTWEWTDNSILCIIGVMRKDSSLTSADFDWDLIEDEADRADTLVSTKTGTEKRSRLWGLWPSEAERADVIDQMLRSAGAELKITDEGKYWVQLIDDNRSSEITFVDGDIIEMTDQSGPEAVERPNICRVKYYSPERDYEMFELDLTGIGWARIDSEVTAYGEKYFDVDLPFCPDASQAQRIARRLFATIREETVAVKVKQDGWAAWGLSTATLAIPQFDESVKVEIQTVRASIDDGYVEIHGVAQPVLTAWSTSTDEASAPEEIPDFQSDAALTKPAAPTTAIAVTYPGGQHEIRVDFAAVSGADSYLAVLRYNDANGNPTKWYPMTTVTGQTYAFRTQDLIGEEVRFRYLGFHSTNDNYSDFSPELVVASLAVDNTATAAPTVVETENADGADLDITCTDFNVVKVLVEANYDGAGWSTHTTFNDVQPNVEKNAVLAGYTNVTINDKTLLWRVSSFTTDGTQGSYTSGSVVIVGTGGP